jgi:acyl carrier protein
MSSNSNIEAIQNWLVNKLAEQLSLDPATISVDEPLTRYGLDSIDAVTMVGDLEDWLDEELPSTLFWDRPTIAKSALYLDENYEISVGDKEVAAPKAEEKKAEPAAAGKGWGLFGKK